jgi:hypothetical protein
LSTLLIYIQPTNVVATAIGYSPTTTGKGTVRVSWNAPASYPAITSYNVALHKNGAYISTHTVNVPNTSIDFSNQDSNATYNFCVGGVNAAGKVAGDGQTT